MSAYLIDDFLKMDLKIENPFVTYEVFDEKIKWTGIIDDQEYISSEENIFFNKKSRGQLVNGIFLIHGEYQLPTTFKTISLATFIRISDNKEDVILFKTGHILITMDKNLEMEMQQASQTVCSRKKKS